MENVENINGNVPRKVMAIESKLNNTPVKPPQTLLKSFVEVEPIKEYSTPNKSARPATSKSCSKLACSTPTPFSPGSVNTVGSTAREAARIAKMQSTLDRVGKVAELKEKWAEERKVKQQMSAVKRKNDLKKLQDTNSIAAENRRKALESQRQFAERQKLEAKQMLEASLEERKLLAADLELKAKASRRISIFLNRKVKESYQKNEAAMTSEKKQFEVSLLASKTLDHEQLREYKAAEKERKRESMVNRADITHKQKKAQAVIDGEARKREKELLASKREDHLAVREAKTAEACRKRESMAGRTESARKQKVAEKKMIHEAEEEEKYFIETRHLNWKDDHVHKEQAAARKRESMMGRNQTAVLEKKNIEQIKQAAKELEVDQVFNVRQQNWEDERNAKVIAEQRKRESLAGRLDVWRQHKEKEKEEMQVESDRQIQLLETRHTDWQDLEEYKKTEHLRNRESLSGRLEKWRQDREVVKSAETLAAEAAAIETELQQGIYQDVKNHEERLRNAARQSMAGRVVKGKLDRAADQRLKEEAAIAAQAEARIHAEDYSDVKQYQLQQQMEARMSLENRTTKARADHAVDEKLRIEAQEAALEDARFRGEDYSDVKNYEASLRLEARKSLEARTQKARADKAVEEKLKEEADFDAEQSALWAAADRFTLTEYTKSLREARRQSIANNEQRLMEMRQNDAKEKSDAQAQAHLDSELEHLAWQDVQEYQRQQREAARKSLAGRLAAASEQHKKDIEAHGAMLSTMHDDLELRRIDWQQLNQYKKEDKDRKRKSMMLRNESAHIQRMAEEKLQAKKMLQQQEDIYLREMDRDAVLSARAAQTAQDRVDFLTSSMVL